MLHVLLLVIIIVLALSLIYCYCRLNILRGGTRTAVYIGPNDDVYCKVFDTSDNHDEQYASIVKIIEEYINKYTYINIVTVNKPVKHMVESYTPAVFVDPSSPNARSVNSLPDCVHVMDKVEGFVSYMNSRYNNILEHKVKYYHIDYGVGGGVYNTYDNLKIIKNWLRPKDGYIVMGNASSNNYFGLVFHVPRKDADNHELTHIDNNLAFMFEAIIPDNQRLIGDEINAHDFLKHPLCMNNYPDEFKPYYIHNITYVFYMIKYRLYERFSNSLTYEEALHRWGLNEVEYNKLLTMRKNPTEAEKITLLHYLYTNTISNGEYKLDIITRLYYDYLFLDEWTEDEFIEQTLAIIDDEYTSTEYNITHKYSTEKETILDHLIDGTLRWVNIAYMDIPYYILNYKDNFIEIMPDLINEKENVLSAILGISINELKILPDSKQTSWNQAMLLLKPIP